MNENNKTKILVDKLALLLFVCFSFVTEVFLLIVIFFLLSPPFLFLLLDGRKK